MMLGLLISCTVCAVVPAVLFCMNLRRYRAPGLLRGEVPAVSVLIPARNEAEGIETAVRTVLASVGCAVECVVMDDGSTDGTREVVERLAREDGRVRLEEAPVLPPGWNGKQHACWALAHAARHPVLCFVDADVRVEPECVGRMAGFLEESGCALVSGFPRQITGSTLEWLLLPLIHFVLLGFLPMGSMRKGTDPAFAAGCGQFLMVRREAYFAAGGHAKIRWTMHDGLRLPRLLREAGYRTDLADLTGLARVRMYATAGQVWRGLAKNATEGIADPRRIGPISLTLLLGQVVPFVLVGVPFVQLLVLPATRMGRATITILLHGGFVFGAVHPWITGLGIGLTMLSVVAAWAPRWLAVWRFRQDWRGALLHPVGIAVLLVLQWYALGRKLLGAPVGWRDRVYQE